MMSLVRWPKYYGRAGRNCAIPKVESCPNRARTASRTEIRTIASVASVLMPTARRASITLMSASGASERARLSAHTKGIAIEERSMIENPFLIPPQVEGPQSRSWGRGFAFGFKGPVESVQPGVDFDVEDVDAFNQGTVFGQDLAIQGLIFTDNPCVDLNREPPPDIPELVFNGRDIASVVPKIPKFSLKLSGVVFGAITTFIDLSIALKTHFDDPNQALQEYGTRLRDLLMAMHRG